MKLLNSGYKGSRSDRLTHSVGGLSLSSEMYLPYRAFEMAWGSRLNEELANFSASAAISVLTCIDEEWKEEEHSCVRSGRCPEYLRGDADVSQMEDR